MNQAVMYALIAMFGWALWAVASQLATDYIAPEIAMVVSYLVGVSVALTYVVYQGKSITFSTPGFGYAIAGGIFTGIGAIAFYTGFNYGNTATVTTISALYFVLASAIGIIFLNENITLLKGLGIAMAAVSIILLSQ